MYCRDILSALLLWQLVVQHLDPLQLNRLPAMQQACSSAIGKAWVSLLWLQLMLQQQVVSLQVGCPAGQAVGLQQISMPPLSLSVLSTRHTIADGVLGGHAW